MRNSTRRALRVCCVLGIVLLTGLMLLPSAQTVRWSGTTDVTIEFVVTDAETGEPIPGAEIYIQSEVSPPWSKLPKEGLKLSTDETGTAHTVSRCRCDGVSRSVLLGGSSRVVSLPDWIIFVAASGYTDAEPFWLNEHYYRQDANRDGTAQEKRIMPIALYKARQ